MCGVGPTGLRGPSSARIGGGDHVDDGVVGSRMLVDEWGWRDEIRHQQWERGRGICIFRKQNILGCYIDVV
jgi:hypothetical protein